MALNPCSVSQFQSTHGTHISIFGGLTEKWPVFSIFSTDGQSAELTLEVMRKNETDVTTSVCVYSLKRPTAERAILTQIHDESNQSFVGVDNNSRTRTEWFGR